MNRYCRGFLIIVGLSLIGISLTNLVVNPWRIAPSPLSSDGFDAYRDFRSQNRTGKCGLIRTAPEIGIALIGSSRVANSLDPLNPNWNRNDVYNLGCNACFIYESEAFFRYLLKLHDPELVILGIDPSDLSTDFDTRGIFDFEGSPLGPENSRIDRELRYLVGISTLESSFETIKRRIFDEAPQFDSYGLRRNSPKRPMTQRDFLKMAITGEAQFEAPQSARADTGLRQDKAELLRGIAETCHLRGIRLVLLIHPQHALSHTRDSGEPILPFERERREITELADEVNRAHPDCIPTEVWDFGDYHPINSEPLSPEPDGRMSGWDDFNHYALETGDLILARIMGWQIDREDGRNYGLRLTPQNFDEWASQAKKDYAAYQIGVGRADIEWARKIKNEASKD